MSYKILSRRSSFLERSITFEVDGKLETISAPPQNATFDDLIQQIEERYGKISPKKAEPAVGNDSKEEAPAIEEKKEEPAVAEEKKKTTSSKKKRSSSSSAAKKEKE
jgi:hypothetical protein